MKTIGILGGGQLAMYLAESSLRQGLAVRALCGSTNKSTDEPVSTIKNVSILTDLDQFLNGLDFLTFENEFIDISLIRSKISKQTLVHPSFDSIQWAQNKISQKKLCQDVGLGSAEFLLLEKNDSKNFLNSCFAKWPSGFVLKWSMFGYDGLGTFFCHSTTQEKEALDFISRGHQKTAEIYAEQKISFLRELALISTRNSKGDFKYFPLVVSEQQGGICRKVYGPAIEFEVATKIETQAQTFAKKIGDHLNYVGTFALEFFLGQQQNLLLNEMAPRVHNTGHFSLSSPSQSQFDTHIQAVIGSEILSPKTQPYFAMLNLIGPKNSSGMAAQPAFQLPKHSKLFWYAKKDLRAGRKMGHLNGWADEKNALKKLMDELETCERNWSASCQKK